jgi:dTDP-4-amino-4,6-dideoxygalactose transaminase
VKIEFYKHNIGEAEIQEIVDTLKSTFLTTGPKTAAFEKDFAAYLGVQDTIGVMSATAGLFLVLKAWDIRPGDEVIVPPMTFIATANAVLHCGATPVFVDVEPETGNIDAERIEASITPRTKAILPVHLYGQIVDMRKIRQIADKHGLKILEDSAHTIEGTRDGNKPGQIGDAASFSFYATKNIACGEGGAVVTNDPDLAEKLRILRLHGMSKSAADRYHSEYRHWDMEMLGYKENMSDIQASLLLNQLKTIEEKWERKERICRYYESEFQKAGIEFPKVLVNSKSARHLFTVWAKRGDRDRALGDLQKRGLGVAVNFRPIHLLTYYRERFDYRPGQFPVAEEIGDRTITIPMYPLLTDPEVEYVVKAVVETLGVSSV